MNNLNAQSNVLDWKVLSNKQFNCSDIRSLDVFLTKDGDASVLIKEGKDVFVYAQNHLRTIDKKGKMLLNGFEEKDHVMLAFVDSPERYNYSSIDIYDVQKGFNKPIESIEIAEKMQGEFPEKLIAIPQTPGKYYVFYIKEKFTFMQFFTHVLSGGHGAGCAKPYLAEVDKGRISKYKEIKYGGKKIEDFFVKEIINDAKMIHCLGFRQQYNPEENFPPRNSPFILYYAGYDLEKKKVTQNHSVYEISYDWGSYNFGPLSMACKDDEVFVVFSFHKYPFRGAPQNDIKQISSDIYYFQYGNDSTDNAVQIARGFMPLVKVDHIGNVYVFWIDYNGNLVCKMKKDDKWSKEEIVLNNVDIYPAITFTRYVSAKFDKDNNLNIVFPSNDNIVYAKVKLD